MKQHKHNRAIYWCVLLPLLLLSVSSIAQNPALKVFEEWTTTAGTQNFFQKSVTHTDAANNVYVAGATVNGNGDYDILVAKYNSGGTQLWINQYAGAAGRNDFATALCVDPFGNVIITGTAVDNATDTNDVVVIKYTPGGIQRWVATYDAGYLDAGADVTYDADGNIFVTGSSFQGMSTFFDIVTLAYDSTGSQQWVDAYDNANLSDGGYKLLLSGGRLYVTGVVQTTSTDYEACELQYNPAGGGSPSASFSSSTSIGFTMAYGAVVDSVKNIYITGSATTVNGLDYFTIKLDSTLSQQWTATYDGSGLADEARGISVDKNGNVYVTGYSTSSTQGKDYATIKYDNSGSQQWVATYNDPSDSDDVALAIVLDSARRPVVTGYYNNGTTRDYLTIKYDASGNELWCIGYNGLHNNNDQGGDIAYTASDNGVIVTGQSKVTNSTMEFVTVKYVEKKTASPQDTASVSNSFFYTENRGQLLNTDTLPASDIRFYTLHSRPEIFFSDTSTSYVFFNMDTTNHTNDSAVRVDMKFVAANSGLQIRHLDARSDHENFYRSHIKHGRERVQNFNQLACFNVWNNVDMIYGSNLKGLKYYFICKPGGGGASYTNIDLKYGGADSVKIDGGGQLIIYTRLGNIVQPKAAAWQLDASGNFQSLGWQPSYNIVGTNEVKFTGLGSYNSSYPLVFAIDWGNIAPVTTNYLDWSTYYAGDINDDFYKLDMNHANGDVYCFGQTMSTTFPTTPNAYQGSVTGGWEALAVKFNEAGVRQYATLYGTGPNTQTSNFSVQLCQTGTFNPMTNNFFLGGSTSYFAGTDIGFPNTQPPGAYVDTVCNNNTNGTDGFIAEFETVLGTLVWSTYYGGTGGSTELIRDMGVDANGNLYCVMDADSLTPHRYLAGAYNDSTNRSSMILKFDQNRALKWATNFGTKGANLARLTFSGNQLYVTGSAKAGLPVRNPGGGAYYDTTLSGVSDVAIAQFNPADSLIWCTYFGGTATEAGYTMSARYGDLFLTGVTTSGSGFPWLNPGGGAYVDTTLGGSDDVFIARFKNNGMQLWTTYYGGSGSESQVPVVAEDNAGNFFVGGSTKSTDFPYKTSPYAYSDSIIGNSSFFDGFVLGFNSQNQCKWGTYFGGYHNEGTAQGMAIYKDSLLFVGGTTATSNTASPPFPLQNLGSGAWWQPSYQSQFYAACVSRFTIDPLLLIGIHEQEAQQDPSGSLWVYPNPGTGSFQVVIQSEAKNRKIEVYNSIGQLVETHAVADGLASQTISLNLNEKATGIYFIILKDDSGLYSRKVIKQ